MRFTAKPNHKSPRRFVCSEDFMLNYAFRMAKILSARKNLLQTNVLRCDMLRHPSITAKHFQLFDRLIPLGMNFVLQMIP